MCSPKQWMLGLLIFSLFSCDVSNKDKISEEAIAAEVYGKILTEDEVQENIPFSAHSRDSVLLFNNFVERWVRRQIYLREAEKEVSKELAIDKLVNDYKESLVIHHFENYIAQNRVDTSISNDELRSTYEEEKEFFVLTDNIYRIIRLYAGTGDLEVINDLKDGVANAKSIQDVVKVAEQNNLPIDTTWISQDELVTQLGKEPFEALLDSEEQMYIDDCQNVLCLNKIVSKVDKNELAPFSYVEKEIAEHVYLRRKQNEIEKVKEELYQRAVNSEKVKVNYQ